jgi:hypothetical protein
MKNKQSGFAPGTDASELSHQYGMDTGPSQNPEATNAQEFNYDALRLPQDFAVTLGVKKVVNIVPVRRPSKTDFFRVRAGEEWRFQCMVLELKEEGETYVVAQPLWAVLPNLLRPAMLHLAIDRRDNVFLIPVPLPGQDGRRNSWHQSMAEIVVIAEKQWVRTAANKSIGGYDAHVAQGQIQEPNWPDLSMRELVEIAFRGRIITSLEHPVVRQLQGLA